MTHRLLVAGALLALVSNSCRSATASAPSTTPPGALVANAVVDDVVDGDTVDVMVAGSAERIRLIGIDTPETKRPDTPVECHGPEATAFTESLLATGTPLHLERDIVGRDDYGRILVYAYRATDGLFVNYEIVRRGFAQPLSIAPNTIHADLFVAASRAAEADDIGLWAAC